MSVNYVELKICLLKTSTFIVTLTYFLGINRSGPTTNQRSYMWPWDDFMVHGVNSPAASP